MLACMSGAPVLACTHGHGGLRGRPAALGGGGAHVPAAILQNDERLHEWHPRLVRGQALALPAEVGAWLCVGDLHI